MATASPLQKSASPARERIDVRLRPDQKSEIERAAYLRGLTITDFILLNAIENARQTIREHESWTLQAADAELFAAALAAPPDPGPQLRHLAQRRSLELDTQ